MRVDLRSDYSSLDRAGLAGFAAGCALHVSALLIGFASPERRDELERWLQQLQDLAASPDPLAARRLKEAVEAAPEAEADDSNAADYYAMRALSVVAYAAEAWFDDDPVKFAQWSADEAADLMRTIAFSLEESAPPLEELEVEAQRELLGELERTTPENIPAVLSHAREAPIVAASRSAAIDYARVRGWILLAAEEDDGYQCREPSTSVGRSSPPRCPVGTQGSTAAVSQALKEIVVQAQAEV